MIDKGQWGNFAMTPGLPPYSLREVPWDFFMTTESQDLGLTSHLKDGACSSNVSQMCNKPADRYVFL